MKKMIYIVCIFTMFVIGVCALPSVTLAVQGGPISGTDVGLEGDEPGIAGTPIQGIPIGLEGDQGPIIAKPGILPTSPLYFLKQWGRGITRFFTFDSVAKAELELNITNQIASEVLEVNKIKPDDTDALKKALENFTDAQEQLNMRIGKLPEISNSNVEKLLKEVDEKTAKHAGLLEQLMEKNIGQLRFEVVGDSFKKAQDNILKTFTITVTPVNDEPAMKQKAEDQIKSAEVAISEANTAMGDVSTTRGMAIEGNGSSIFDRWGSMIAKSKFHLDSAKKLFAEGKYGEAYGQARSAEAIVLSTGVNFPDKKVDIITPTTPSAETKTKIFIKNPNKEPSKVSENESPRPTERESSEQKPTPIEPKPATTEPSLTTPSSAGAATAN